MILSRIRNAGTERNAATVEKAGTTHSEDLKKLATRCRSAHDMQIRR
jgi:hypothetical protein